MDAPAAVAARYYDGRSAAATPVMLEIEAGRLYLEPPLHPPLGLGELRVAARIAGVPLSLRLPDEALLELAHTPLHVAWLAQHFPGTGRIARLEGSGRAIAAGVLALVLLCAAVAVWGVPFASRVVAERLPRDVVAPLAAETLAQLDRLVFAPSELAPARRAAIAARFATLAPPADDLVYRLEFRRGGAFGPNAIALPDATIVLTDELVGLADDDDEIAAVLLHEIGHVEHRHSLRMLLSHAGLATLAALVFGDLGGIGNALLALPGLVMEQSYSRDLEWEADSHALARLAAARLEGADFVALLARLERCRDLAPDGGKDFVARCRAHLAATAAAPAAAGEAGEGWHSYLSTHPATAERLARFTRQR